MKMRLLMVGLLLLTGCGLIQPPTAGQFTANTTASANKDGFSYTSNKNQEALDADGEFDPATGAMKFHVKTTATTPEAAIAASLAATLEQMKQNSALLQALFQALNRNGGVGGAPAVVAK